MTRRRLFARRPLNMQQYIHRATVGLPKTERLDVAAELRTHLVERINVLRAAGHPTEEAEYLAVQAMGDPAPTNRGLLRHAFTHRAGWLVLGAVLLGGGGWAGYGYVQREWTPPSEGLQFTGDTLTLNDLKALNTDTNAPRGIYQTATLTYPRGTKTIYYALITPHDASVQTKDVASEITENLSANQVRTVPGSYRYQERWLITEMRSDIVCPGTWEFYANVKVISGPVLPARSTTLPGLNNFQQCTGVQRRYTDMTVFQVKPGRYIDATNLPRETVHRKVEVVPQTPGSTSADDRAHPLSLRLNHWTVLRDLVLDPHTAENRLPALKGKAAGMYLAVLPSDSGVKDGNMVYGWDQHGNIDRLKYGGKVLPDMPKLDVKQGRFVAR